MLAVLLCAIKALSLLVAVALKCFASCCFGLCLNRFLMLVVLGSAILVEVICSLGSFTDYSFVDTCSGWMLDYVRKVLLLWHHLLYF